jgi:hypothetical protein
MLKDNITKNLNKLELLEKNTLAIKERAADITFSVSQALRGKPLTQENKVIHSLSSEGGVELFNGQTLTKQELLLIAIHLNPNHAEAYRSLAGTLKFNEKIKLLNGTSMTQQTLLHEALDHYNRNLENLAPSSSDLSITLSNDIRMTEQQLLLEALKINPEDVEACKALEETLPFGGSIRLNDGKVMSKQELSLKAIEINPKDV